jgi:hypothetical protein
MHIFFICLASITTLLWITTGYLAFFGEDLLMHFFAGLIATVSCLITHCWVFFYFIGTGEGIREGILENKLDTRHIKTSKRFKGMTFPFALFSMIFMIVATVMGAGVQSGKMNLPWHYSFVYFALAFNFFSFYQEHKVIQRNRKLMQDLNAMVD